MNLSDIQYKLNQTCDKIVRMCKHQKNVSVMVDCMVETTDGGRALLGCRKHSRYEGENAAEQIRAVEAIIKRVREHALYGHIWYDGLDKNPRVQRRSMEILDTIMGEVSDQERNTAHKAHRDPQFASKSTEAKIDNRSTYHQVYLSEDATDMTGQVVHARGLIDSGQPGGACQNTYNVSRHFLSNSIIRIIIGCEDKVVM